MPLGRISLNFANPIIYQPANRKEIEMVKRSFGLWDDPPVLSGFNPDTDVERDVIPQEKDYVYVPFRMISATILGGYTWKATDFTDEKILRKSVPLLANKPIYLNHNMSNVLNNVGVITSPKWTEAFTSKKGEKIPAGIDGLFKIDAKINPKVARDLLSKPPTIQSDSVTILYEYKQSHEFTNRDGEVNEYEFEYKIGTMVDGRMVRRIVTGIEDYIEVSLVSMGADPFGKILDENGEQVNVDKSGIVPASAYSAAQFDKDPLRSVYEQKKEYYVKHCYSVDNNLSLKNKVISNTQTPKNSNVMEEFIEFLVAETGLSEEELTSDSFKKSFKIVKDGEFAKLKANSTKLLTAEKKLETVTAEKTEVEEKLTKEETKYSQLVKEKEALEPLATFGKNVLQAKRDEAKKLVRIQAGKSGVDEAYFSIIDKADDKELDSILKQHGGRVYDSFAGTCKKCNSTEIDFRSTVTTEKEGEDKPVTKPTNRGLAFYNR